MYVPRHFEESRTPVLQEFIRASRLATLVTVGPEGPVANHLPLLLDAERGPLGTLIGHVARANPVWRDAGPGSKALAVFLGPDAYITPSYYPSKRETGEVVPTWNYAAVHARGTVRFLEDELRLREIVTRLTETHEALRPEPWSVSDAPEDYLRGMLRGIVGLELTIERLEGKWKMSQNRSPSDRAGVSDGLARDGLEDLAAMVRGGPKEEG